MVKKDSASSLPTFISEKLPGPGPEKNSQRLADLRLLTIFGFNEICQIKKLLIAVAMGRRKAKRANYQRSRVSKKSFPLSSVMMNAGKSLTVIMKIASIPSSGYSRTSMAVIQSLARRAAGPPMEPR